MALVLQNSKEMPWERVLDVLAEKRVEVVRWRLRGSSYSDPEPWKPENMQHNRVIGGILESDGWVDMINPPEELDLPCPNSSFGFLPRNTPAILDEEPEDCVVAWDHGEMFFSSQVVELLRDGGAQFDTGPVFCHKQKLKDWHRVFPKHEVSFLSPDILVATEPDEQNISFDISVNEAIAESPLRGHSLALDRLRHGFMGRQTFYVVSLDLAKSLVQAFGNGYELVRPVYDAAGPVGQLLHRIKQRLAPLLVPPPAPVDAATAEARNILASFTGKDFTFELVHACPGFGEKGLRELGLAIVLCESGKLPEPAWHAPIASWVLARLFAEAGGKLDLPREQGVDGGGYCLRFNVKDRTSKVVSHFQLQGDTLGTRILGRCRKAVQPRRVVSQFTQILLRDPANVAKCCIRIYDPEWEEDPGCYAPKPTRRSRNTYGWDGKQYLGAENIWDVFSSKRPKKYVDYLRATLRRTRKQT